MFLENDRKANIEVLESNKNANKEEIRRLREDNKEFRQKSAHLQKVCTKIEIWNTNSCSHLGILVLRLRRWFYFLNYIT